MLKILKYTLITTLVVVAVGTFAVVEYVLPYAVIKPMRSSNNSTPEKVGLDYEAFKLSVEDTIDLDAVFVPATVPAKANLLMLHGIGSCKEVYYGLLPELTAMGYNVLLWDQRAHGKSGGTYTTFGYKERHDVAKGLDWLDAKTNGLPAGVYGNSMGGAVALQSMATDERLGFGLIESTFTDLPAITQSYGSRLIGLSVPRWLTDRVLRNAGEIAKFKPFTVRPVDMAPAITQPVQLIHGSADANINVKNAHTLFEALGSKDKNLYLVEGGDHADLWDKGGGEYRSVWMGFLARMVK